jgi:hypothetical protein
MAGRGCTIGMEVESGSCAYEIMIVFNWRDLSFELNYDGRAFRVDSRSREFERRNLLRKFQINRAGDLVFIEIRLPPCCSRQETSQSSCWPQK